MVADAALQAHHPVDGIAVAMVQRTDTRTDCSSTTELGPPTVTWLLRRSSRTATGPVSAGAESASPTYDARNTLSVARRNRVASRDARPSASVGTVPIVRQVPPSRRSTTTGPPTTGLVSSWRNLICSGVTWPAYFSCPVMVSFVGT